MNAAVTPSVPVIEANGIVKSYGQTMRLKVLDGVDLTVNAREIVALEGRSGSGKSTLLNILGCLDRPDAGTYRLGGTDVSTLDREAQAWVRLHYLGFVFQSFHLIRRATALENVAVPLFYAGFGRSAREERARSLLERVGLGQRATHTPAELSGGQNQRVAIARALACSPKVLLADEPTGALDTTAGHDILELLADLRRRDGLTVVLVTHDPTVAATADRRIYLQDGRVLERQEYAEQPS